MTRRCSTILKPLSDLMLADALARTPADQYVVWNGGPSPCHPGSIPFQAFRLIEEAWRPTLLRILVRRAARLSGTCGLDPGAVRNGVRAHQGAAPASYFLVRRTESGDFVAVCDVPNPSSGAMRLSAGDIVLSRSGARFDGTQGEPPTPATRLLSAG